MYLKKLCFYPVCVFVIIYGIRKMRSVNIAVFYIVSSDLFPVAEAIIFVEINKSYPSVLNFL